ncbi:MAG: hypothetical protein QOJ23_5842 [Actinomycetota bacterium]|nr:hypothetical protein [Actinomycetota bacterium]
MLAVTGLLAAIAGGVGPIVLPAATPAATASADHRQAEMASPSPFRGLLYDGLSLGRKGSACDGAFEAKSRTGASLGCSHGPDPAPPGTDVRRGRADGQVEADLRTGQDGPQDASVAAASLGSIGCIGDGMSGSRVQAIYAVPADRTDRSATVVPAIRATYAPRIDWQFNTSAAETGGEAHVNFVTEPDAAGTGCQLSVAVAHLTAAGDDSFSNTATELRALGYNRPDRKYLVWTDAAVLCGVGSLYSDAQPGLTNLNNGYAPMFARIDAACWDYAEGHELMHTLGAVQSGAPHATAAGHCYDEPDEMCYDDDGNGPVTMLTVCTGRSDSLFDCNHDDYFYAGTPPALNWLATHWNTYNSKWLLRAPLPSLATIPLPPGSTGPAGSSAGTGSTATGPNGSGGSGTTGTGGLGIGIGSGTTGPIGLPPLPIGPTPLSTGSGYWMLTGDGHVHPFGDAAFYGQPSPLAGGARAADLEPTPSGNGYWTLDDHGRVRAYGDAWEPDLPPPAQAPTAGSVAADRLDPGERAVSLSATPSGDGYWVFTSRGRAVPFGDAGFFGDVSAVHLNQPVVGSVATPTGQGYYLFASDGGIFTFGDAAFFGSTGAVALNKPVVAMAVPPSGGGYWLVGSDGGLFAFGAAGFFGSMGSVRLNRPVSAVVPGRDGYLMVGEDGGAFSFGDVAFFGSLADRPPTSPVVSVALRS